MLYGVKINRPIPQNKHGIIEYIAPEHHLEPVSDRCREMAKATSEEIEAMITEHEQGIINATSREELYHHRVYWKLGVKWAQVIAERTEPHWARSPYKRIVTHSNIDEIRKKLPDVDLKFGMEVFC